MQRQVRASGTTGHGFCSRLSATRPQGGSPRDAAMIRRRSTTAGGTSAVAPMAFHPDMGAGPVPGHPYPLRRMRRDDDTAGKSKRRGQQDHHEPRTAETMGRHRGQLQAVDWHPRTP
ncbi:hypothetical protein ALSL_1185 [Aerosticca soli]|uniref:Uncharacterized protein n=1 Tax=Aerosticca soli TaxID=2010829 RepID=A0A2Z6E539_9GAMM|nr:hypothetical protein ALSL_1185 [Aerosticca soli]